MGVVKGYLVEHTTIVVLGCRPIKRDTISRKTAQTRPLKRTGRDYRWWSSIQTSEERKQSVQLIMIS